MTAIRIVDEFLEDATIVALSDRAYRLYVSGLVYCGRNLTDGVLNVRALGILQVILGWKVKKYADELVAAGLWVSDPGGGYRVKNYLRHNKDSEAVKEDRRKARERMTRIRSSGARSGERNGERSGEQHANVRAHVRGPYPSLSLPEVQTPSRTSYEGGEGTDQIDERLWRKLVTTAKANDPDSLRKLERTVRSHKSTAWDAALAIEAARGPGVRDPLAVALSELKKRGQERVA